MILRRKRLPPELEEAHAAFQTVLAELEPAKAVITDVLPGTRMPGRPLEDALSVFERGLRKASELMDGWRRPELESEWVACREGLAVATALAAGLRRGGSPPSGFEELLGTVQQLLDPLEPFGDAESRFRALRRKG